MSDKLTNRQLLTIHHIIASPTLEDARRKAKLSKGTLYAWLKDSTFNTELTKKRNEIVKESSERLKFAVTKAVDGLIELMNTPRPDLKRWVYKDIIEYTFKTIEIENIEERLLVLEKTIGDKKC